MNRRLPAACMALSLVALAACVTVNIYFPAPAVREAAEEITEETWGEAARTKETSMAPAPALLERLASFLAPASAYAAEPDINVSTAAIRALKAAMSERAAKLEPSLAAGRIGVAADGSIAVRDFAGVPLGEQASVRRLIDAENRDREALYREIAEANNFGTDRVGDVRAIFAETWQAQARRAGWWTQAKGGSWVAP
jgi:uncharacterized protein YdbL (DUF1318 family)